MPQIKQSLVYSFDELNEESKTVAINQFRSSDYPYDGWADCIIDDFKTICGILGVDLDSKPVRMMHGRTFQKPCIYYSGFCSQGDGACFEGDYTYKPGSIKAIKAYAPQDKVLHGIATALYLVQKANFFQLNARTRQRGHYYHALSMAVDVERDSPTNQSPVSNSEDVLTDLLRDLANWLFHNLRSEYDHLSSDSCIIESIIANDYSFTETGQLV